MHQQPRATEHPLALNTASRSGQRSRVSGCTASFMEMTSTTSAPAPGHDKYLRLGRRHLVYLIVLAGVLGHLQADLLPLAGFGDGLALDLHRLDALAKVARVPEDADRVADAQGSRFEPYRRDGKMAVIVGHETHPLFARQGAARGGGSDCRRPRQRRPPCRGLYPRPLAGR